MSALSTASNVRYAASAAPSLRRLTAAAAALASKLQVLAPYGTKSRESATTLRFSGKVRLWTVFALLSAKE
jgi:hypothetical protein